MWIRYTIIRLTTNINITIGMIYIRRIIVIISSYIRYLIEYYILRKTKGMLTVEEGSIFVLELEIPLESFYRSIYKHYLHP